MEIKNVLNNENIKGKENQEEKKDKNKDKKEININENNSNIIDKEKKEGIKSIPITKNSSLSLDLFSLNYISEYKCIICGLIPSPETAIEKVCCGNIICNECYNNNKTNNDDKKECQNCKSSEMSYRKIKNKNKVFYKILRNLKLNCPYKCEWNGIWSDLDNHLNECKYGTRYCKYKSIGCEFIDENNKVNEHEKNNDKFHLELALKYIKINKIEKKKIKFVLGEKIKTSVHQHIMTYMTSWNWHCDERNLPNGCYSSNPGFDKTVPRFRCHSCDFDLCNKCVVKYVIN